MICRLTTLCLLLSGFLFPVGAVAASVWKISTSDGKVLYLGGSIHALRTTDYPLPPGYSRAFDASSRVVFEIDPKEMGAATKSLLKAGEYSGADNLRNHVDPRTYDYLKRFFRLINVPEQKFSKFKPWCLAGMLQSPQLHGLSRDLGVEGFISKRARDKSKPMSGLESLSESVGIFANLSDQQSEALLLLAFIPMKNASSTVMMNAWRHGDVDTLTRMTHDGFRDFPSLGDRLLDTRNKNWMPKIESFLNSGQNYFVVVGAAHLGGPNGLLAMLKAQGYKTEQL